MRPVTKEFPITQPFAGMPTGGVIANSDPESGVGYYVWLYGDYQHDGHGGADIGCPVGTPVHAIKSGTVVWADWDVNLPGRPNDWAARWFLYQRFGGRIVGLMHGFNDFTFYAHLSGFNVSNGQWVNEGDLIGWSGDSSAGADGQLAPHLHVEHLVDTNYPTYGDYIYGRVDPVPLFGEDSPVSDAVYSLDDQKFFVNLSIPLP